MSRGDFGGIVIRGAFGSINPMIAYFTANGQNFPNHSNTHIRTMILFL